MELKFQTSVLIVVGIMLIFSAPLVANTEEVKVPFEAIKSSCYGEIDMTKAEFPLSEVGKECVQEDWLEENLLEEKAEETKDELEPVSYDIVTEQSMRINYGGRMAERVGYNVVVGTDIEREQIRPTVEKIISDIRERNDEIDLIHLYLYSTKSKVKQTYEPYDIAMADWAPEGQVANLKERIVSNNNRNSYKIKVEVKENLKEYLGELEETEERQDTNGRSMVHNLAIINSSGSVAKDDVTINRFKYLLESIASKTKNTQQEIGDMSVKSVQILKEEYGREINILDFMESANDAIPPEIAEMDYAEVCASMIVMMK